MIHDTHTTVVAELLWLLLLTDSPLLNRIISNILLLSPDVLPELEAGEGPVLGPGGSVGRAGVAGLSPVGAGGEGAPVGQSEVSGVAPPAAAGPHRDLVPGAVSGQPALLEPDQVVVDGDLVGHVVAGLGEGNHLLEELSQLDLELLQPSRDTNDLRRKSKNLTSLLCTYLLFHWVEVSPD